MNGSSQSTTVTDMRAFMLRADLRPTIPLTNRLEGRPRTNNFSRALRAEIRDPLWMITKQWQMGEFKGDDAGSPILSKVHMHTTCLTKYKAADNPTQLFEDGIPLEAKVEQKIIPFTVGNTRIAQDIRLLMGRQWLKMLRKEGLNDLLPQFVEQYPFVLPDPDSRTDTQICAHKESYQKIKLISGRFMDGSQLYVYITGEEPHHASDHITCSETQRLQIQDLESRFITWFNKLFYQPVQKQNNAWKPSQLEYSCACSAPGESREKIFTAEEYFHGQLDWYNFDIDKSEETLGDIPGMTEIHTSIQKPITCTLIPTQIQFNGMPHSRWWSFEDGTTNFGNIKPDTTDLNKLMVMEFGLVYANDWYLIPFTVPVGSISEVKGVSVTNVFGEKFWIDPAGKGLDDDWQKWRMYGIEIKGDEIQNADQCILILPTVPKIQESKPTEEIFFIRDEVSNMVWAIENRIPIATGDSKFGHEAANELVNHYERIIQKEDEGIAEETSESEQQAPIRYRIMTSVPENWIPFIPVHAPFSHREIQLQRASMPRIINSDQRTPEKIEPRTTLLREGLDRETPRPYYLFEEEVPRAGIRVYQSFQRTRFNNGKVYVWLGTRKQFGRKGASSGLEFDLMEID